MYPLYFLLIIIYFYLESYFLKPTSKELKMLTDMEGLGFILGFIKSYPIHTMLIAVFAFILLK